MTNSDWIMHVTISHPLKSYMQIGTRKESSRHSIGIQLSDVRQAFFLLN